ncbi:MAG: hypothetical protein RR232_08690, partial [Clostridia bacterium]
TLSNIFKSDLNKINSDDLLNFINIALESESDLLTLKKGHQMPSYPKVYYTLGYDGLHEKSNKTY